MNTLSFVSGHRPGSGTQRGVDFDDFAVDGVPLQTLTGGDATRLEAAHPEGAVDGLRKLIGLQDPDFPDGRIALYVCGECGDYGCGASTARVTFGPDEVVWDQFGWQTDYDPVVVPSDVNADKVFRFARPEYERTLGEALARFIGLPTKDASSESQTN